MPIQPERVDQYGTRTYVVLEPDPINIDYPVRYTLTVSPDGSVAAHVLCQDQPGPFLIRSSPIDMFVSLQALVDLGKIAEQLLAEGIPND